MMRSLFSGVSGLKNHQTRMDVVGNNISNVNTYGFKTSRVTFQDMLSQTIAGAAKPEENKGGVNPKQIGLGMTIASIDRLFTQGSLQTTGNQTDLAISGDGFFITARGDKKYYTRAGNFTLDKEARL
jgi:flagellar hook protein FlgE